MKRLLFLAMVSLLFAFSGPASTGSAASGTTTRVSVASDGTQGNNSSYFADINPDGRYVAFASDASNLVSNDTNGVGDVFIRDTQTGVTERVSVGTGASQGNGESGHEKPALSADGRYVAFSSAASNLVPGDTNNFCDLDRDGVYNDNCVDVFVRDRQAGTTEMVSVSSTGMQGWDSYGPAISADGRFVAFWSYASNLVVGDSQICDRFGYPYSCADVFVRDRQTGSTSRVSVGSAGTQANGDSYSPALSGDGRFVAFYSYASNLVAGDSQICYQGGSHNCPDVFVHDRGTGATSRVSVDSAGAQGNDQSGWYSALSGDGRFVAFLSQASNLVAADFNGVVDVFVRDRVTGITELASVNGDGVPGNASSFGGDISDDGRFVVFDSFASNLVPEDSNSCSMAPLPDDFLCRDVFVHDRRTGATKRVSVDSAGNQSDGASLFPSVSASGRFVVFYSWASNLVPADTNDFCDVNRDGSPSENCPDVFVHDLGDSDSDAVPDPFDNCPAIANADQKDNDSDGMGDACDDDDDNDTVLDAVDNCPRVSNLDGQGADADGDMAGDACDAPGSGNVDCSPAPGGVSAVDALKVLRKVAALSVSQAEPCTDIGMGPLASGFVQGDVNCSDGAQPVSAVDALMILRVVAGLPASIPQGCPAIRPAPP